MKKLEELLSAKEAEFVRVVYQNPGAALPDRTFWEGPEGTEPAWVKPLELGLVKQVSDVRWLPTPKLDVGVVQLVEGADDEE